MTSNQTAHVPLNGAHRIGAFAGRQNHMTRRHLQVVLGALWVLDGVLQAQPFMFTRGFSAQIIAPTGQGQPGAVSGPVEFAAATIGAHPFALNVLFAAVQVLLGLGLLVRRTARVALIASIAWALGVWYLGEGLSGLASRNASLLAGVPGSALLYAILAAAAWPAEGPGRPPARWLVWPWMLLWVGGAVLQVLPGQNSGSAIRSLLEAGAGGAPHRLAWLDTSAGALASNGGAVSVYGLAAVEFLVGVTALSRVTRTWALVVGLVLSVAIWVVGQDFGQLYSGQATDPNSAPLIALMAVALLARPRDAVGATAR